MIFQQQTQNIQNLVKIIQYFHVICYLSLIMVFNR